MSLLFQLHLPHLPRMRFSRAYVPLRRSKTFSEQTPTSTWTFFAVFGRYPNPVSEFKVFKAGCDKGHENGPRKPGSLVESHWDEQKATLDKQDNAFDVFVGGYKKGSFHAEIEQVSWKD